MARAKKTKYEFVERDSLYRKRVKDATGKTVAIYGQTPEDITEQLVDFEEQRDIDAEALKNPLFSDYAQRWFVLNCGNLSKATKKDYLRVLKYYVLPPLEDIYLKDVRSRDIKAVIAGVSQKSASVHNKTFMLLKRIFTTAFEDGIITTNPCPKMHNGGVSPKERSALTEEQVEVLLEALEGTRTQLFCLIALYAGLRTEEILALQWDCVHLGDVPRIDVRRAVRHERNQAVVSDRLKSKAARRTIPLPDRLSSALREAKASSTSAYVLSNQSGGPLSYIQFKHLWHTVISRSVGERTYYKYNDGQKMGSRKPRQKHRSRKTF